MGDERTYSLNYIRWWAVGCYSIYLEWYFPTNISDVDKYKSTLVGFCTWKCCHLIGWHYLLVSIFIERVSTSFSHWFPVQLNLIHSFNDVEKFSSEKKQSSEMNCCESSSVSTCYSQKWIGKPLQLQLGLNFFTFELYCSRFL